MEKIIVANFKMNLTYEENEEYLTAIKGKITNNLNVIICPSFPYLYMFRNNEFKLGAQNTFFLNKGSYTGEVSPLQLKTIGVEYVIVGHSERRLNFNENNEIINKKIKVILNENIKPIICVGETKEQKLLRKTMLVIKKQIEEALNGIDYDLLTDIIIAYEPIWSIGTGIIPTNAEISDAIKFIKELLINRYNVKNIKVLYGGSVNQDNIKEIMKLKGVDGALIASAAIDANNFLKLLDCVENNITK